MSIPSDIRSIRDKTDFLLLHLSSLLGIIFIFLQILIGGIKAIILFIPLIILVIILPIYIGFIRGAIFLDLVIERVRGWHYLIIGCLFYLYLMLISFIDEIFDIPSVTYFVPSFIIGFISSDISHLLSKKLFHIFGIKEITNSDRSILKKTVLGAIILGISMSFIVSRATKGILDTEYFLGLLFFSAPMIFLFFYLEKKIRYIIKNPEKIKKKKNRKNIIISLIVIISPLIIYFVSLLIISNEFFQTIITYSMFGVFLVFIIVFLAEE